MVGFAYGFEEELAEGFPHGGGNGASYVGVGAPVPRNKDPRNKDRGSKGPRDKDPRNTDSRNRVDNLDFISDHSGSWPALPRNLGPDGRPKSMDGSTIWRSFRAILGPGRPPPGISVRTASQNRRTGRQFGADF